MEGPDGAKRFHSVILDESECKGCTVCVTTCPVEAIRVRDGKARILAERCIDCGECIRRCPNRAKRARADSLSELAPGGEYDRFDWKIALPAPSLYGQFPSRFSVDAIHRGLLALGFDAVFPVSRATSHVARAARDLLDREKYPDLPRPLISSSCPTIVKVIQIRFPTLIEHIAPILAPIEIAGRLAREEAAKDRPDKTRVGCFFISPCAGKITEAKAPIGNETSSIDGVFSMKDVHLPILQALAKAASAKETEASQSAVAREIAWGRAGGEAEATVEEEKASWLACDGMDQCERILEAAENGKLGSIDLLELMACAGGCVGGPLAVENATLARHALVEREKALAERESAALRESEADLARQTPPAREEKTVDCLRAAPFAPRPALLLDGDFGKARAMMEEMEAIAASLPGLDCGCCGSPNCHALAEDIVRGNASRSDCVIILKEQYRELLERGEDLNPTEEDE
jgi:iron only hydrogenase large subunit-like protein